MTMSTAYRVLYKYLARGTKDMAASPSVALARASGHLLQGSRYHIVSLRTRCIHARTRSAYHACPIKNEFYEGVPLMAA